jgi:predicted phosphoribosyltransferase
MELGSPWGQWFGRQQPRLENREQAGRVLAEHLTDYRDDPTGLILALPRGGAVVGHALSLALHLPLEVFLVCKIGAPGNPEYALGALAEIGPPWLNRQAMASLGVLPAMLNETIQAERGEMVRRQALYRGGRPLPPVAGRTVVLVDDGLATGATFLASVQALKGLGPKRLIAAIPVGPKETILEVEGLVDELVALLTPEPFYAVGNHYEDFTQVEDDAVLRALADAAARLRDRDSPSV